MCVCVWLFSLALSIFDNADIKFCNCFQTGFSVLIKHKSCVFFFCFGIGFFTSRFFHFCSSVNVFYVCFFLLFFVIFDHRRRCCCPLKWIFGPNPMRVLFDYQESLVPSASHLEADFKTFEISNAHKHISFIVSQPKWFKKMFNAFLFLHKIAQFVGPVHFILDIGFLLNIWKICAFLSNT